MEPSCRSAGAEDGECARPLGGEEGEVRPTGRGGRRVCASAGGAWAAAAAPAWMPPERRQLQRRHPGPVRRCRWLRLLPGPVPSDDDGADLLDSAGHDRGAPKKKKKKKRGDVGRARDAATSADPARNPTRGRRSAGGIRSVSRADPAGGAGVHLDHVAGAEQPSRWRTPRRGARPCGTGSGRGPRPGA